MNNLGNKFDLVVKLFFLVSIVLLFSGFYYLYKEVSGISSGLGGLKTEERLQPLITTKVSDQEVVDFYTKEEVERLISRAMATISGTTTKEVIEKQTVVTEAGGTTYVPMGTTATTTSMDWVNVDDSAVYIDIENDYGKDSAVFWQASLKVAHGNGQAFARLYDDTHKIAVDGSEISTTNNASYTQVSSGNLPFWKGRNLYKVQIKSLNSFEVTYSSGKIKVNY